MNFLFELFQCIWIIAGCLIGLSAVLVLVLCIAAMIRGVKND